MDPDRIDPDAGRGDDPRFVNRAHLIDAEGGIVARYDKIHLFDVALPGQTASRESDRYSPGSEAVLAPTPWGPMALTICYDLRFPHLYRQHAKAGARVMLIPSAFAMATGEAHWELLCRARAVENGCFVIAAAQEGRHDDGRKTWGRSLAVDPWGRTLADLGTGEKMVVLDLDLGLVEATCAAIPSLANERPYRFRDLTRAPEGSG
ncbi:nitrilase-related carbon-nitrogen hydrolase [Falsirhodobacter sp. 20TX0035]|uniref:nitrilase-related carbon-nitrogen hydrolase n=1 Tax=Falsirhodobacter sp. 20TX0035 TaxID=3022019 RepID=UPI00232FD134|nr:nitrilase-related carbon-nitrogen hydrolase [Falsirhodobacter sp. 20TX0035]MDB6454486.1 carbon-nitrogen hydrolase family protein [Falsirhodobacter sp. 20TX0035]